jgi:hypothetical protein
MLWSDVPNIRKIPSSVSEAMICPVEIKRIEMISSPKYNEGAKIRKAQVGM